jgi:Na+-driven multidrug efflux pump
MFRVPREMAVEIRRIALLALPTTFEWSSWILGAFFVNRFVVPYGTAAVALFHICLKLQTLFVLPSAGLNQAGITLVGRAYGAGELGHIPAWKQTILKLGIAGGMVGLLVLLIIPRPILSVFIAVEDLAAMRQIRLATAISGVLVIAKITNIIMGSVLRSMGYIRYFVVLSTLSCVVTVSLGYTFTSWLHLGVAGAFAAMLSDELLRNAVHFVRFEWFVRISGIKHRAHERTRPTPAGSRA